MEKYLTLVPFWCNVSAYLLTIMKKTTEQKLLKATLKLISEKGYLGATTREIALGAGVTELTLFRHFGSKEKLFEEMLNTYTFLPKLKVLLPELEGLSYKEALTLIAVRFLQTLKERKAMIRIMHSEVTIYPEKIRGVYNKFINDMRATFAAYFETLQDKGILRKKMPPQMAARVFLWIFVSYFRSEEIMRPGGMKKNTLKKDVKDLIDIFTQGTMISAQ
jgi:AcrR family transcriptional regulator